MIDIILQKLGTTTLRDFVASLIFPLKAKSDEVNTMYLDIGTRTLYNGQKMVLQKALNEIFSQPANTYYIDWQRDPATFGVFNISEATPTFVYNVAEATPLHIFNDGEAQSGDDFVVYIPGIQWTTELDKRVKAEVQKYKVVGTTFTTDTY